MIKHLKCRCVNQLKMLHKMFGERGELMRKKGYIGYLTPILLNNVYNRRHEVIANSFSVNLENLVDLKRMIPRLCHDETIIPE